MRKAGIGSTDVKANVSPRADKVLMATRAIAAICLCPPHAFSESST